jgi:hypothetical protein
MKGIGLPATASSRSLPTTAVQGMLRNTTELGDTGPFAVRPPRIPRSNSRPLLNARQIRTLDTTLPSHSRREFHHRRSHRPNGPSRVASSSALSGRETILSTQSTSHPGPHSRRPGHHHRSHGIRSPHGPLGHPLNTHRSMVTLRTQRTFHSLHSSSPMPRPHHHPRPLHRASSPAVSEAWNFRRGVRRAHPRAGSVDTAASSPAMTHRLRTGLPGYCPEFNGSFSSSVRLPSPAVSFVNGPAVTAHPVQRTMTPMSASLQNLRPTWNYSAASFRGIPRSPTESTAPHYYDYSESFPEEDCFSPPGESSAANLPFNLDQTIPEDQVVPERRHAQSPFGTMPGSTFSPLELPTSHNRRESDHSKHSYTGVIQPRRSSLAATTAHQCSTSRLSADPKVRILLPNLRNILTLSFQMENGNNDVEKDHAEAGLKGDSDDHRASATSHRASHSAHFSTFFPNTCRSPRDLTSLAARVHSPEFDQKPSISSLLDYRKVHSENEIEKLQDDPHQFIGPWQLPSFNFRPLSFISFSPGLKERPKTSGDIRQKPVTEILSPMPERPMSSQSRRRFSRILEIPDGYAPERSRIAYAAITCSRLDAVEEHPDLQGLERSLCSPSEFESKLNDGMTDSNKPIDAQASPIANGDASQITLQERSTIESLLDRHIECLGLDPSSDEDQATVSESASESLTPSKAPQGGDANAPPMMVSRQQPDPLHKFRPMTSSSTIQHSSLASSERRRLIPRRLFASMDAGLPSEVAMRDLLNTSATQSTFPTLDLQQRLSGWQTLPSASRQASSQSVRSTMKASLSSGDMADIDTDPPGSKFKVRRVSQRMDLPLPRPTSMQRNRTSHPPRRSKSDVLARQASHQRRRGRILLKAKRKSTSLGQLARIDLDGGGNLAMHDLRHSEDRTTDDSREGRSQPGPRAGYAELSAESMVVQPPTILSAEPSVLVSTSAPRRWTSMLAAMPEPVKKSLDVVRKSSICTIQSQRSNNSVMEPLNSTRYSSQIPRVGSVPQLAPPEFGPPLMSSDLNLTLRLPETPLVFRPHLRQAQSFFSDDSSTALAGKRSNMQRKRFDLHSFRSGFTKSTSLMGTKRSSTQHNTHIVKTSISYRAGGRESLEYQPTPSGDTVPLSDFAYKKRKVLDRVKEWWKRQCMQKTLNLVRKKSGRHPEQTMWT